jgi:outer membrane receptor protein involved in Fe transport
MKDSDFRILILLAFLALVPAYSSADIEEKSSIIGSLVGAAQKPVAGVTVRLMDSYFLNEVAKASTDIRGKFTFHNILPGLYLVAVDLPALAGMFKRVQVVSDAPTFIDLQSLLNEEDLKKHDAWDKFKWTIRVAGRNPLRDEYDGSSDELGDGFFTALKNFKEENNIRGEVAYVSLTPGPSANAGNQMTQFAVKGELEEQGAWSFNGNIIGGISNSYMATGDVEYLLYGHRISATVSANDLIFVRNPELLDQQLIRRFIQSSDLPDLEDETKHWMASADFRDEWKPVERLTLNYGTRVDYYGYMNRPIGYSPRFEAAYDLTPGFAVRGGYYRSQSAPGSYYLQPEDIHPYVHNLAFLPYSEDLVPEMTQGYEAGVEFSSDQDFRMSILYHQESVSDKIATVDISDTLPSERFSAERPFVILNSADLQSHGVEVQITKRISSVLSAVATYRMNRTVPVSIIEKNGYQRRTVYFKEADSAEGFHDVHAGILASIPITQTQVQADWKWSSGTPLVFGYADHQRALAAIDVEFLQAIPVQFFSQTELQLMVAIKNLLDQNSEINGNADFQRALVYNIPRIVAGGLLLKF